MSVSDSISRFEKRDLHTTCFSFFVKVLAMFNVCLSVMVSNLRNRGKAGEFSPFFVVLMDFWSCIL